MPYSKVRRSGRLSKQVPIVPVGSDAQGKFFSENTQTVVLSQHGAGILFRFKLLPEQELNSRCLDSNLEAEIRIVGEIASGDNIDTCGVAFLAEQHNFWQVEFPAPPQQLLIPFPAVVALAFMPALFVPSTWHSHS
jgi:hypothetical protein